MDKKGQTYLVIIILLVLFGVIIFIYTKSPGTTPGIGSNQTACTADAKLCPGGTYVGRSGLNCEFKCPNLSHNLTLEDILTNNLSIICVSGYSNTVRDVSESLKNEVYIRDNITKSKDTAIDHIVPLCLGGSNDIHNLRAMYILEKVKKDNLERYLCNNHVCDGEVNINYAQQRIAEDWYSYYLEIYG